MILTCCICDKDFKVKDPLINMCNYCSRQTTKTLKKLKKSTSKTKFFYSNFFKFQDENPRQDKSYNEMLKNYGL